MTDTACNECGCTRDDVETLAVEYDVTDPICCETTL